MRPHGTASISISPGPPASRRAISYGRTAASPRRPHRPPPRPSRPRRPPPSLRREATPASDRSAAAGLASARGGDGFAEGVVAAEAGVAVAALEEAASLGAGQPFQVRERAR